MSGLNHQNFLGHIYFSGLNKNFIKKKIGKNKARQPFKSGFEAEDSLYILPIITYYKLEFYFITAAAIGAPIFYIFVMISYQKLKK